MCCVASPVTVGDGYFETLSLPLIDGRLLGPGDHDPGALPSVVIDEAAADRWWPDENPIGQLVRAGNEDAPWNEVVGVVGNVTFDGPGEVWPHFYHSHNGTAVSHPFLTRSNYLTVRSTQEASGVLAGVRGIVQRLDPKLAIAGSFTMDEVLDQAVAAPRFIMSILSVFAFVALALGAIGIYGVLSYGVALRAGEIGIRRALGAAGGEVVGMVIRQSLVLAGIGVLVGLAGAFAGTRAMGSFLHGVSPTDPATFLAVTAGVFVVALAAALVPARRASGVSPLDALRAE